MTKIINDEIIKKLRDNPQESSELLRCSLKAFIKIFHYYIYRKQFIFMPFHDKIIKKLEDLVFGRAKKKNLYIGLSPRFGKTQIAKYFIDWGYTLNKYCNFIETSYGDKLALKFSAESKSVVESSLYKDLFNLHILKDTTAKDLWQIKDGGEFRATPLKGVITGFGAGTMQDGWGGCLLVDDYLKADNYKSDIEKQNCIDIYTNTLKSRLNNDKTPIVIIAQRLAKDDLVGWLMENEPDDWDFFILPTLDENDKSIWEEKMPSKKLIKMREVNPFLFYSQYQQEPIVAGGSVIKTEWFRYYKQGLDYKYRRIFITGDTAQKVKEANDYTVFCVWGVTVEGKLQLLDMVRGKWEAPDLIKQAVGLWNRWREFVVEGVSCSAFYVEDKSSGTALIQTLKAKMPIIGIERNIDKLTRAYGALDYMEAGLVELPNDAKFNFNPIVLSECEAFTRDDSHKHDDICDNIFDAVNIGLSQLTVSILDVL